MAEIPSSDSMQRAVPGAPGARPSLRYQSTPDTGVGLVSRALERAGATLDEVDAKRQAREDRVTEARASTALAKGLFKAYQETDDNDYGTQVRRFSERASGSIDEAAGMISNPELRELFMARAEGQVVEWSNKAHQRALKVEGAARVGELEADLPDMLERASALDEKGATAVLGELNGRLQALVDIQAITPSQMQEHARKFGAEYAETRIRAMGASAGYNELGKGDKGLGKFLPPLQRERLRESLEHDAAVETAYSLVDAAGGRQYSDAELKRMPVEVRVVLEKIQDNAKAQARADINWQRSNEAYARTRAEREAIELTPKFLEAGVTMGQTLKIIEDSDLQEFQKQIIVDQVRRHFSTMQDAEAQDARALFSDWHSKVVSGEATVTELRLRAPKQWDSMSSGAKQALIDAEGAGTAGTRRFVPEQLRRMGGVFREAMQSPAGAQEIREKGIGYLRSRTMDDDFVSIAESLGWGGEKLVADARTRLAESGSELKVDAKLRESLLKRGLSIIGAKADTDRGRLFEERFNEAIVVRQRQRVMSGQAPTMTLEDLTKIRDELLEEFELERFGPNPTRRAFEIGDEEGEVGKLTVGNPVDLKIVNKALLDEGVTNPTSAQQDDKLQKLFMDGTIFELRRQYRSAPGGR